MEFDTLDVRLEAPVGRLRLNRPDKRNAITETMLREIATAAGVFDDHPDVRAVIVDGAGPAFCAGVDLDAYGPVVHAAGGDREEIQGALRLARLGREAAASLERMQAVTVVAVHGYAVGGGVVLVAACDLRVAAGDAYFWIPEVELGTPLAWGGVPYLVREVGPARAKEMVMACRKVSAAVGRDAGFVNEVVSPDEVSKAARSLAQEIADKPALPIAATKAHVNAVSHALAATSYADPYVQLSAFADPQSVAAADDYLRTHRRHGDI